jgi:hypothetical protein
MSRFSVVAIAIACLATPLLAQSPSEQVPIRPVAKTIGKKPATSRSKPAPAPMVADSGPCRLGVIPAVGDLFAVDKIGLTVFGNEHDEVVTNWGLDDLIFARVRAAAGPDLSVRRITYPAAAFDPYYHPRSRFLPDPREGLPAIVQGITGNAGCERYLVITKFTGELQGTNVKLAGVGVYNRGLGNIIRHSALFANIALTLLDGQTYARQQRFGADFGERLQESLRLTENPLIKLDNEAFPEPAAAAAGSPVLRDRTRALVANRVDRMLPGYLKQD